MAEQANDAPNQNNTGSNAAGYLDKAAEACAAGDLLLGMHLYLAAYEQAAADRTAPSSVEVTALRKAWHLSCDLKERSLAEYVFEKLEPYLTGEEIAECAMKLQELALDRLEQYGVSREELEDMAEAISQDFLGEGASVMKVESISIPNLGAFGATIAAAPEAEYEAEPDDPAPEAEPEAAPDDDVFYDDAPDAVELDDSAEFGADVPAPSEGPLPEEAHRETTKPPHVDMGLADVNDFNPYKEFNTSSVGKSYHAATNEGSGAYTFTRDVDRANELARATEEAARKSAGQLSEGALPESPDADARQGGPQPASQSALDDGATAHKPGEQSLSTAPAGKLDLSKVASAVSSTKAKPASPPTRPVQDEGVLSYRNLVGYDEAIAVMRDFGVGLHNDPGFLNFVRMLNNRHGLNRMPALDTLMFRAPAIEDASRFAEATVGELGLPVLRMSMEEGMGGMPVLCVTTQGNNRPRMNHAHNRFEGPGILVIEDLDMWVMPEVPESPEGFGGFMMANISRGAREAVNLIRSAVEDPDVFVLATASMTGEADPFFYEILEPITIVDIGNPNAKERADIWAEIARDHPSFRNVDADGLLRYSEGLPRYDMYMAAREAVDDAYKLGLIQRTYIPVTPQIIYEKLASFQAPGSERYHELEEAIVDDFRADLDHLEDLLDGR